MELQPILNVKSTAESLVKKYIGLRHFSHFFRTFAVLFISFITNNLIYSIIP